MNKQHPAEIKTGEYDLFQIAIGDTERNIDEILANIRKSDLPIIQISQETLSSSKTASGSTINIKLTPESINEEDLKRKLNEYGGCAYQIDSVVKTAT